MTRLFDSVQYNIITSLIPIEYYLEIRHLRYFVAVAEHLHFGKAAEYLHISQPPLTRQIQQLEEELGVSLLARTNRRVELTPEGRLFLDEAKQLVTRFDALKQRASEAARGQLGKLSIGFISVADYHVLPSLLSEFQSRFPNVTLNLREATTDIQLNALREGEIDIGIVLGPVTDAALEFRPLFREELVAVLPASDKLSVRGTALLPLAVKSLADRPFVMFPRPFAPGLYDHIVAVCARGGFTPRVTQEAIQMQTIISLVSVGMGVALVPASLTNLGRAGVIYRPLKEKSPLVITGLAWKNNNPSNTLRAFLDLATSMKLPPDWRTLSKQNSKRKTKTL